MRNQINWGKHGKEKGYKSRIEESLVGRLHEAQRILMPLISVAFGSPPSY
jgi:hypothetical protein